MTKRIWTYIVSGIMMAVSCAGLLLFLFLPKEKPDAISPLNSFVSDMQIEIGQTITDFYSVSMQDCEISFSVDKEGLIEIDKDKIVGISAGEVNVKMKIVHNQNTIEEAFKVIVLADECSYEFSLLQGCEIEGNNVYVNSSLCQFRIDVYGRDGKRIDVPEIETKVLAGEAEIFYEMNVCKFTASAPAQVMLEIAEHGIEIVMNLIVK